jgi:hypothetical protein
MAVRDTQRAPVIGDGQELAERAIAGHGGMEAWERAGHDIAVRLSAGGFAFASKLQGHAVRGVDVRVATQGQSVVFEPYPVAGRRGLLVDGGEVRIETEAGAVTDARANARQAFGGLRHRLWWDRLDILYFGTQAIWTYISTPFVFMREGYELSELEPWDEQGERWRRLAVTFPRDVHTHSREQIFYIDASGVIRRHDYTAEPFGDWAKAAHYCYEHRDFDGLLLPVRRLVYPRRADNTPRSRPRLVWIEVSEPRD